jgi:1-acyl-sn-glycerol-3-phosphate acyltransferase
LNEGYNTLIFPEGGRQTSGVIAEFKPIIGYLALNNKTGILPVYIWGTFEAFPKGATIPKKDSIGAKVGAKVGRFLKYDELLEMTKGVPNTEAYRLIAARVQHEIENMRDGGRKDKFDVAAVRKRWRAERRKTRKQEPVIDE